MADTEGFAGTCPTCHQRDQTPSHNRFFLPVAVLLDAAQNELHFVDLLRRMGDRQQLVYTRNQLERLVAAETLLQLVEGQAFGRGWDRKNSLQVLQETGDDLQRPLPSST